MIRERLREFARLTVLIWRLTEAAKLRGELSRPGRRALADAARQREKVRLLIVAAGEGVRDGEDNYAGARPAAI